MGRNNVGDRLQLDEKTLLNNQVGNELTYNNVPEPDLQATLLLDIQPCFPQGEGQSVFVDRLDKPEPQLVVYGIENSDNTLRQSCLNQYALIRVHP